ncbi:hypothetical protein [Streptomyces cinereoruber]|uniref:hypothetical protein n=1 Tax=Streptomyces cinereoruber TaxID=67260 RepID=UPI0036296159
MDQILTTLLPDGRTVHVAPLVTVSGAVSYQATDQDGKRVASGWLYSADKRGIPAEDRPAGGTHLIPGMTPVWFTAEEAAALGRLGEAAKAAHAASANDQALGAWRTAQDTRRKSSAARMEVTTALLGGPLGAERNRLQGTLEALVADDAAQEARAHDDSGGDPGLYYRVQAPRNEKAIEAARRVLDEFDAAHPEVLAALDEERRAAHERFMDVD